MENLLCGTPWYNIVIAITSIISLLIATIALCVNVKSQCNIRKTQNQTNAIALLYERLNILKYCESLQNKSDSQEKLKIYLGKSGELFKIKILFSPTLSNDFIGFFNKDNKDYNCDTYNNLLSRMQEEIKNSIES